MLGCLDQSYGAATASSTSSVSIFAHASARACLPTTSSAAFIALLIFGTSTRPQLELVPLLTMYSPLKGTLSTASGSPKSASQPTFGQTSIFSETTPQYFEYITDWSTTLSFVLKPRLVSAWLAIWASSEAGLPVEPTTWTVADPVYFPLAYPASFMYFPASSLHGPGSVRLRRQEVHADQSSRGHRQAGLFARLPPARLPR